MTSTNSSSLESTTSDGEIPSSHSGQSNSKPERQEINRVWNLTNAFAHPPKRLKGKPLSEDEILQALVVMREARSNASVSLSELVRISTFIQNILHKTKLKKHVCFLHMQEIRDRFKILASTLKKVARGVFDSIFDEFCAEKHISVEEINEDDAIQCKQVRAISESVRAIQREITCVKLNRVISENAAAGLQI